MVNIKPVRGLPRSSFFWSVAAILGNFVRTYVCMYVCRAHAPASHAACHDDHENSNAWFSQFLSSHGSYGAPLCGPSGRCGAPLLLDFLVDSVLKPLFTALRVRRGCPSWQFSKFISIRMTTLTISWKSLLVNTGRTLLISLS